MWAAVTWVIGAKLLPEPQTRTDMGELLRVIGYAYAPQLFAFFAFIPVLGGVVSTVVAFWLLAATILAVRRRSTTSARCAPPPSCYRLADLRRHPVGVVSLRDLPAAFPAAGEFGHPARRAVENARQTPRVDFARREDDQQRARGRRRHHRPRGV